MENKRVLTKGDIEVQNIKLGDIQYEFGYGFGIKSTVIELPSRNEEGYWSWKNKTNSGKIIDYGVKEGFGHYGPNLYAYEAYTNCKMLYEEDTEVKKKRVIVAGSRTIKDTKFIYEKLEHHCYSDCIIVSGGAIGVDTVGKDFAFHTGQEVKKYLPDWQKHGKAAGHIRNEEMAKNADVCICFWDGESKGTRNMINNAINYGLELHVYILKDNE